MHTPTHTPHERKLPAELLPTTSWKRLWLNIAGTLLLVLVANWAAGSYLSLHTPNKGYWIVSTKWDVLLKMDTPVDTLVLGDSSALQAFIPAVWQTETGERAANQAVIGSLGVLNDAWMLQVYLARFGPPKRVIVIHVYDIWQRPLSNETLQRIPIRTYRGHKLQPALEFSWTERLDALPLGVPLYSENYSLRRVALAWLENPLDWRAVLAQPFQLEPGGYDKLTQPEPETVHSDLLEHLNFLAEHTFEISPLNQAALDELVQLSEQYGFALYLANGPLFDGLAQDPAFQTYFAALSAHFEALAARHASVDFMGIIATFPADQLESVDHTIHPSAVIYTRQLAREILK